MLDDIERLSRDLGAIQERIEELRQTRRTPAAKPVHLLRRAEALILSVRHRTRHFGPAANLFVNPAWNILLDLYAREGRGLDTPIGSAGLASGVPSTTSLRWIDRLTRQDLITRERHETDGRQQLLRLTVRGIDALEAFLAEPTLT